MSRGERAWMLALGGRSNGTFNSHETCVDIPYIHPKNFLDTASQATSQEQRSGFEPSTGDMFPNRSGQTTEPSHSPYNLVKTSRQVRTSPSVQARDARSFGTIPGWTLTGLIGKGARTIVHSAHPSGCPQDASDDYAVKVLASPHESDHFAVSLMRREAHVGRRITHAHLIPILAAGMKGPPYFVVMPRLRGVTLAQLTAYSTRIAVSRALWIGRQIAEGLSALHLGGYIHCDVKPANMFVTADGHATLLDLGFCQEIDHGRGRTTGPLMVTLSYAAPECFSRSRPRDEKSDIYSLGVTLYELLTGRRPFPSGDDPQRLSRAHMEEVPVNPRRLRSDLPRELAELLLRMLAKEPMRRPFSAKEVVNQLVRFEIESFARLH